VDYFIYNKRYVLDNSPESSRYLANASLLAKKSAAFKFHFRPEAFNSFKLVYQTPNYRIYKVIYENDRDSSTPGFVKYYYPLYDLKAFASNNPQSEYFNDTDTNNVLNMLFSKPYFKLITALNNIKKGNTRLAEKSLAEALDFNPHYLDIYTNFIYIYQNTNRIDAAVKLSKRALRVNPNIPMNYSNLAMLLIAKRDLDNAKNVIENGINLCPWHAELYNAYGIYFTELKKYREAATMFKKAIELNPKDTEYKKNLAIVIK
jgi:Tfp pilus assembly protein PilF